MKFQLRITSARHWRGVQAVALLTLVLLAAPRDLQAAENKVTEAKPMTTARPAESMIVPLFNSMAAFDKAVDANNGKPPKDARLRLKEIQALADKPKLEYKRFAIALKSAGEIDSFNSFITAKAKETGSSNLIAQASHANPYKILQSADTVLNSAIKDRRRELRLATGPDDLILKLLGIGTAEAGFFRKLASTTCSFVVFTMSPLSCTGNGGSGRSFTTV